MIENDKVIRERAGEGNVYFLLQHCTEEEELIFVRIISQSKNVNGTELESF